MMQLPSQITAAALSTLVILGVKMLVSLEVFTLSTEQISAINDFVVVAAGMGFGIMLWWVNRGNPNPTAPGTPPAP